MQVMRDRAIITSLFMPANHVLLVRLALFSRFCLHGRSECPSHRAQGSAPQKRPGVRTLRVRIPMDRLKPEQVFAVPGAPDWLAIDEDVWVSNEPKNSVTRIDPTCQRRCRSDQCWQAALLGSGRRLRHFVGAQLRRVDDVARRSEDRQSHRHTADNHRRQRRRHRDGRRQRLVDDRHRRAPSRASTQPRIRSSPRSPSRPVRSASPSAKRRCGSPVARRTS